MKSARPVPCAGVVAGIPAESWTSGALASIGSGTVGEAIGALKMSCSED